MDPNEEYELFQRLMSDMEGQDRADFEAAMAADTELRQKIVSFAEGSGPAPLFEPDTPVPWDDSDDDVVDFSIIPDD